MSRVHGILEGKERFKKSARLAAGKYSDKFLTAIDTALEFKPTDRPQSMAQWRLILPDPPGFERTEPEDDSGMDLLLIPDEEEEQEEETVVLSAPLIPASADAPDEEEETVVLSAPLIPAPPEQADEEEETVVLSAPLVPAPSEDEAQESAVPSVPLVPAPSVEVTGDDEETVILGAAKPSGAADDLIISSPGPDEAHDAASEQTPSQEPQAQTPSVAPPTQLGDDEETVILGAPIRTSEPSQLGDQDETVILSAPVDGPLDPDDEPTVVAPSTGDGESGRVPFATIRANLADLEQPGKPSKPAKPEQKDEKTPGKKRFSGLLRQIGAAAGVLVAVVAMWFLLNPQDQRDGFKGLSLEERAALQSHRKSQKTKEEEAAQLAAEEEAAKLQEDEAAKPAQEQVKAAELAQQKTAEEEQQKLEDAERLAAEEQSKLEDAQRLAKEAERKAEEEAERLAQESERLAEQAANEKAETEEQAKQETIRKAQEAERLAKEEQRLKDEAAEKLSAESVATQQQAKVDALVAGFEADLAALRLTSPAGNNALSKLQTLLVLDPGNPLVNTGFEKIVGKYIGLSQKSSEVQQFGKAENYLDKAAAVFADSAALETAREELALLRREAEEIAAAKALAKAQAEARAKAAEEAQARAKEELAKTEAAKLITTPSTSTEVTKTGPCSPRLLEPRPNAFPRVVSSVYSHPAFLNVPAPKIRWARYGSSS